MNKKREWYELLWILLANGESSELVRKVVSYLEEDLAINKAMSGVNFSSFLGDVLGIITTLIHQAWCEEGRCIDAQFPVSKSDDLENRLMLITFRVAGVAKSLGSELGRTISFHSTLKAIMVMGSIPRCDWLRELEKFLRIARELSSVRDDYKINLRATRFFTNRF